MIEILTYQSTVTLNTTFILSIIIFIILLQITKESISILSLSKFGITINRK